MHSSTDGYGEDPRIRYHAERLDRFNTAPRLSRILSKRLKKNKIFRDRTRTPLHIHAYNLRFGSERVQNEPEGGGPCSRTIIRPQACASDFIRHCTSSLVSRGDVCCDVDAQRSSPRGLSLRHCPWALGVGDGPWDMWKSLGTPVARRRKNINLKQEPDVNHGLEGGVT